MLTDKDTVEQKTHHPQDAILHVMDTLKAEMAHMEHTTRTQMYDPYLARLMSTHWRKTISRPLKIKTP